MSLSFALLAGIFCRANLKSSMPELIVDHVSKEYPGPPKPVEVLRDACFTLHTGQSLAVLGPSGSGKSTLLYIIGAIDQPTSGQVRLDQEQPHQLTPDGLARYRQQKIGFVFQDHSLLPHLSAWENVLVPVLAARRVTEADRKRSAELLDQVGLSHRRDHLPGALSGGERQRVAIARSLVNGPTVLLADEPTGNLDRETADSISELLCTLPQQEATMLVVVTHSQDLAARCDRRLYLRDGNLIEEQQR